MNLELFLKNKKELMNLILKYRRMILIKVLVTSSTSLAMKSLNKWEIYINILKM